MILLWVGSLNHKTMFYKTQLRTNPMMMGGGGWRGGRGLGGVIWLSTPRVGSLGSGLYFLK